VSRVRLPAPARLAWMLAAAMGAVAILVAQFPHLQAWHANRVHYFPDKFYTGALTTSTEDTMTYWGWMQQAKSGRFFFEDLYTPEETPRNYVNLFFWLLGRLAHATGRSVQFVYAAARPIMGVAVLLLLWRLLGVVYSKSWERLACYLVAILPGGWEGLACYLERNHGWGHVTSPGWWIAEMNTFFSMMVFPHFLAGFALMLAAALLLLRAWSDEESWLRRAVEAGVALSALTFVHPYDTVTMLGVAWSAPAAFALVERRIPRREIAVTLVATAVWVPSLLYNWFLFRANPAMRAWDLQNLMHTPEWGRLAIAFGVSGILAVAALFGLKRMSRPQLVMAAWFVSTMILIQLPFRFQRRMLGGVQFPIAVLAVFTLSTWIVPMIARRVRGGLTSEANGAPVLAAVLLLAPLQWLTPYYLLDIEKKSVRHVSFPSWILRTEADALAFLHERTPKDARVLSSYDMGNYVPVFTDRRCVLGHYGLTIDAEEKRKEIARFFAAGEADDAWRRELMARYGAAYVLWTAHERALGDWDPAAAPWLSEVYRAGEGDARAVVYELTSADASR
jgi:hypothetical protein